MGHRHSRAARLAGSLDLKGHGIETTCCRSSRSLESRPSSGIYEQVNRNWTRLTFWAVPRVRLTWSFTCTSISAVFHLSSIQTIIWSTTRRSSSLTTCACRIWLSDGAEGSYKVDRADSDSVEFLRTSSADGTVKEDDKESLEVASKY